MLSTARKFQISPYPRNRKSQICETSLTILGPEHFAIKWNLVNRDKMRQNKCLDRFFDSTQTKNGLTVAYRPRIKCEVTKYEAWQGP